MNFKDFSFVFFILALPLVSFGSSDDISFSLCWMSNDDALEKQNGNIWLNSTALKSIRNEAKVTSLTVYPAVENKLTLQYGGSVQTWTVTIDPLTRFTKIRGTKKAPHRANTTQGILDLLSPSDVFACENNTVFFHQDENFFLAVGQTVRLPVRVESRSASTLLVSWTDSHPAVNDRHTVNLYYTAGDSYNKLSTDFTTNNYYNFTSLDSCSPFVACVEIAGGHSFTCLSAITDPDVPKDFEVMLWNSSSISLSWDCPENLKHSSFLLTAFYLNGTDHITEEVRLWFQEDTLDFTLSDLQPCTRVKFGLQTVCQEGMEPRYSKMLLNDGNSVHSRIQTLSQTSFGPDNYTLSWNVGLNSSISMFRVNNNGTSQGTTLLTSYTVKGLQSCQQYQATVEALCGDGVLMNAKTVAVHTGPRGVSELRYRSNDSTALWIPSTMQQSAMAFLYELALENGTTIQTSRVNSTELHLPGLEEGKTYVLDVWEECDERWESEPSQLCFEGTNSSFGFVVRAAGPAEDENIELQLDFSTFGLVMVVPWSLHEELLVEKSEPRTKMEKIFKDKLQELLEGFDPPARVKLDTVEPAAEPHNTEILFTSFDASKTEEDVRLSVEDQLDHIHSLNAPNIMVADGVIYWDGYDLCASVACPRNSLCINTLGSFTCVCRHGYYDVSVVIKPEAASQPICNEKGLFSQCLDRLMTGGIAKPYLTSHIGGKVDVKLNDGRCAVNESDMFYVFRTSRKSSECGTGRRINKTHIEFQNIVTVTLTTEQTISRRDLKIVWKCVYPRQYIRNAQVGVEMEWVSSVSLVQFNSSLQLLVTMTLYSDESYTNNYTHSIALAPEEILFIQVALQTNNTFASDVLLQVDTCWATESTNPEDQVQGVLLQDSCPVDNTFYWLSVNGLAQTSRFSVQMFSMPQGLPFYIHCLSNICAHDTDCTKNCSSEQRTKRSVTHTDRKRKQAVVSAGPLVVDAAMKSGVRPPTWAEHMTMISIVAGLIGFLGVTILSVSAVKAVMTYYEHLRLQ